MGLDLTHNCWRGASSAFMRWRTKLAEVAGLPPLDLMEGFYNDDDRMFDPFTIVHAGEFVPLTAVLKRIKQQLPIKWECLAPSPLHVLLNHSDSDGEIDAADCLPLAGVLAGLLPLLPDEDAGGHIGNWREKTQTFIDGLKAAGAAGEHVEFG